MFIFSLFTFIYYFRFNDVLTWKKHVINAGYLFLQIKVTIIPTIVKLTKIKIKDLTWFTTKVSDCCYIISLL